MRIPDEVQLTEEEAADLDRRLANPPPALARPARRIPVFANPVWLTAGGQGFLTYYADCLA